jgi:hypothetical protein
MRLATTVAGRDGVLDRAVQHLDTAVNSSELSIIINFLFFLAFFLFHIKLGISKTFPNMAQRSGLMSKVTVVFGGAALLVGVVAGPRLWAAVGDCMGCNTKHQESSFHAMQSSGTKVSCSTSQPSGTVTLGLSFPIAGGTLSGTIGSGGFNTNVECLVSYSYMPAFYGNFETTTANTQAYVEAVVQETDYNLPNGEQPCYLKDEKGDNKPPYQHCRDLTASHPGNTFAHYQTTTCD